MAFPSPMRRLQASAFQRGSITQLRDFSTSKPVLAAPGRPISPHISIYKQFGRPFAKVFLGAVFTYQIVYWAWLRLDVNEMQREKEVEIRGLEEKARGLAAKRKKGAEA